METRAPYVTVNGEIRVYRLLLNKVLQEEYEGFQAACSLVSRSRRPPRSFKVGQTIPGEGIRLFSSSDSSFERLGP